MTERAFTVVACHQHACEPSGELPVLEMLAQAVRHCRHGVLVSATCPLPHACAGLAGRAALGPGATVFVQPCSAQDRSPKGAAVRLGPIRTMPELLAACAWIVQHEGHGIPPQHLLAPTGRSAAQLS